VTEQVPVVVYKTKDIYLATFLRVAGFDICDIEYLNRKATFCFACDSLNDIKPKVREFYNEKAEVNVRKFVVALKAMKSLVYEYRGS